MTVINSVIQSSTYRMAFINQNQNHLSLLMRNRNGLYSMTWVIMHISRCKRTMEWQYWICNVWRWRVCLVSDHTTLDSPDSMLPIVTMESILQPMPTCLDSVNPMEWHIIDRVEVNSTS